MGDPEATKPLGAASPPSRAGRTEGFRASPEHVEAARVLGSEPTAGIAPSGPTGEQNFLAERLALFGRISGLASSGFLLLGFTITALGKRTVHEGFPVTHLAATAALLLVWILARRRTLSVRGLRRLDAAGTIAASLAYVMMAMKMPLSWRPDQLVLLILNAVLLGRAALVPSEPRRTAWISAVSVAPMPFVTFLLFRSNPSPELLPGALVMQATLWAMITVIPATLISSVTFHLRRSIARARRLGQYTLLDKIGEGGMAWSIAPSTRCSGVRRRSSSCLRRAREKRA